jgi:flagellar biosynthesis/type III secretory pathway protein FliH
MSDNWQDDPAMVAAAFAGLAENPRAIGYAEGYQAGRAEFRKQLLDGLVVDAVFEQMHPLSQYVGPVFTQQEKAKFRMVLQLAVKQAEDTS